MARDTWLRVPALPAPAAPARSERRAWASAASERMRLALVMLIALCQGLLYLVLLPPWQHYDEPTHFEYAWLVANRPGLPQPGDEDPAMRRDLAASMLATNFYWNLAQPTLFDDAKPTDVGIPELNHPPAYYLLASLPLRLLRHLDITSQLYAARAVSLLLYVLTIAIAAGIMRELVPPGHTLRWAVPLAVALVPPFADLMTAVNNDVGAVAVFSLFLWGAVRSIRQGLNWRRMLWVFGTAALAVFTKNTAALALALAPLACLVAFWAGHGWRWRWLVAGVLAGALLALPLLFAWGDAAYWYRGNSEATQAGATRLALPEAPLGDYALMIAPPADGGVLSLVSPVVGADIAALAGQKVTIGGWVWGDRPDVVASIGLAYKTPTQAAAAPIAHAVHLSTVPTFVAWTIDVPEQANYLQYQITTRMAVPATAAGHLFLDGTVLAAGAFPRDQAPRFDDERAAAGAWGGQRFANLVRNPSAEQGWPHLRATLDELLVTYIHRSPAQTIAALLDTQRIAPILFGTLLLPATDGMIEAFAWNHVRLHNSIWVYLARALALLALLGGLRWLLRRHAAGPRMRPALIFLLLVGLLIWVNTVLRPLPMLGEPYALPSARYTFPAIVVTMLALLGGWRALWLRRWRAGVTFGLLVGLIIVNAVAMQTIWWFYQTLPLGR